MVPSLHPEHASNVKPGPVFLFGSGETPAGFELNSPQVAGRVAEFLEHHLQNYDPQVKVIPARKRGTAFSPDSSEVVEPILSSDLVFMGPGSPSYAVRQLRGSLAWYALVASRCFIGQVRFELLVGALPPGKTVVGIDEKTGLLLDLSAGTCRVTGKDGVTVIREGSQKRFREGSAFSLQELGDFHLPEPVEGGLPAPLWRQALSVTGGENRQAQIPEEVLVLVEERQAAREGREWRQADALRQQIARLGWQVLDTAEGPRLEEVD